MFTPRFIGRGIRVALAPAFFVLTVSSFGSTIRADVNASEYETFALQFASVGKVYSNGQFFGTGTLISPNWVLTAAHIYFGGTATGSFFVNGTTYQGDQVYLDPAFTGDVGLGNDLALIHLPGAGATGATTTHFYDGSAGVGLIGTSVGYGINGDGINGSSSTNPNHERAFQNVIDAKDFQTGFAGFVSDFDSPDGQNNTLASTGSSAIPLHLEGNVTPGDSGGPLFALFGSEYVQIGVTSYLAWPSSRDESATEHYGLYGDISGWNPTAQGAGWITQVSGVQAVPEPNILLLATLGAIGVLIRRRR